VSGDEEERNARIIMAVTKPLILMN